MAKSAVSYLKKVVERGPWMQGMREALDLFVAGDNVGALVRYSRLAEVCYACACMRGSDSKRFVNISNTTLKTPPKLTSDSRSIAS